jgi:hypothetical protein
VVACLARYPFLRGIPEVAPTVAEHRGRFGLVAEALADPPFRRFILMMSAGGLLYNFKILPEGLARNILIEAFLEPILARIRVEDVYKEFGNMIHQKVVR